MSRQDSSRAFTLIELLIVVAIIAILAAIAVPNFLEAQVRAKVSRARSDMRTLATGIEAYATDYNYYATGYVGLTGTANQGPSVFGLSTVKAISGRLVRLTTPVSYISSIPRDPFTLPDPPPTPLNDGVCDTYDYLADRLLGRAYSSNAAWRLSSAGPDRVNCFGGGPISWGATHPINAGGSGYDPTNGTTSVGDIVRVGGGASSYPGEPAHNDRILNPLL